MFSQPATHTSLYPISCLHADAAQLSTSITDSSAIIRPPSQRLIHDPLEPCATLTTAVNKLRHMLEVAPCKDRTSTLDTIPDAQPNPDAAERRADRTASGGHVASRPQGWTSPFREREKDATAARSCLAGLAPVSAVAFDSAGNRRSYPRRRDLLRAGCQGITLGFSTCDIIPKHTSQTQPPDTRT
jgi:hypothetical protein